MNRLRGLRSLRNRYFALRHGESEANREGIILSAPQAGIAGYGLSERGRAQVRRGLSAGPGLPPPLRIYASDFKRALETARIAAQTLGVETPIETSAALRERFFGELERQSTTHYQQVWLADRSDPGHRLYGAESALAVTARVTALVLELERRHRACSLLLVAHGDVLQLLQCAFEDRPAARHRELQPLATGELRALSLGTGL